MRLAVDMLRIFSAFGLLIFSPLLLSHPVDVCLARVADAASRVKACQLSQSLADECKQQQIDLQSRIAECKAAMFTDQAILGAEQEGSQRVKGDVGQSPYLSQRRKRLQLAQSVAPNFEAFNHLFPDLSHAQGDLQEHFGGVKCPNSFEGANNRWALARVVALERFSLQASWEETEEIGSVKFYAMEREVAERCYAANSGGKGYLVVNIPDYVHAGLLRDAAAQVLICEDSRCIHDLIELESLYQRYRLEYQEYRDLLECSGIVEQNYTRSRAKNRPQLAAKLPDSCPAQEIEVKLKRAKSRVAESDQRLFGVEPLRLESTKSL